MARAEACFEHDRTKERSDPSSPPILVILRTEATASVFCYNNSMAELKTQKNNASVLDFINSVEGESKKQDSLRLLEIFKDCTGEEPAMWGPSIVGYGSYHYKYPSGREGDSLRVGFSPRKQALTIYGLVMYDLMTTNNELLKKLGLHKVGKGCLYIKSLSDVDLDVLKEMITNAFRSNYKESFNSE